MKKNLKILGIFRVKLHGNVIGAVNYCQKNEIAFWAIEKFDMSQIRDYKPDGVIYQFDIEQPQLEKPLVNYLRKASIPLVTLNVDVLSGIRAAIVTHDFVEIGRKMAEEFITRKFRNFIFYGFEPKPGKQGKIETGIDEYIRKNNLNVKYVDTVQLYRLHSKSPVTHGERRRILGDLIKSSPKPVVFFAAGEYLGNEIILTCVKNGISVPSQVSVACLQWDSYGHQSEIPLSGIMPDMYMQGYKAAEVLSRMLRGEKLEGEVFFAPTPDFTVRASSDTFACENIALNKALDKISKTYPDSELSINDIISSSGTSRASLFRLFKENLGTTPEKELMRRKFEKAKAFLLETNWKISEVAEKSGFSSLITFTILFKRRFGVSPARFRQESGKDRTH